MAKKPLNVHVFSHARWDREGRRTLSELRLHAVRLLDEMFDAFERDPEAVTLVLDGQTILIEDYLAVRSRNLPTVSAAIQSGKLHTGPWYILPHQQLASPEALIRNLLIGTQFAAQFGGSFPVGYMPDAYGYLSQMPQILKGFGIGSAVVNLEPAISAGWGSWEAPDGSRLVAVNLCPEPSLNASAVDSLKHAFTHARDQLGPDASGQDVFMRLGVVGLDETVSMVEAVKELVGKLRGVKITVDDLPTSVQGLKGTPQSSATSMADGMSASYPGSVSNRVLLKLRNQQNEMLLESWVEPFSVWAWLLETNDSMSGHGTHPEPGLMSLDVTKHLWKTLLHNHNQATLGGCAADAVYQEALLRFDQTEQFGEELASQSLDAVAARIATDGSASGSEAVPVVVFNAAGTQRTDLVSVSVALPDPDQRYELVDHLGERTHFELVRTGGAQTACHLRFVAFGVPERGYKTYFLRQSDQDEPAPGGRDEEPSIENEFLAVTFDPATGMLNIFDKHTGRSFDGLNHFVDEGDCGSLQEFEAPTRDTVIDIATNTPIFVERECSDVEQSLTFLQIYRLPRQLTEQRDARLPLAAQFVPVSIITQVRLVPGVPRVDVRASIANDALDHRLRVHFAFGSDLQGCLVDGHFEVWDWSAALSAQHQARKTKSLTANQRAFVTLWGSDTSLTIANRGLPEVSITQEQNGVDVALTLIRATGRLQIDGSHEAEPSEGYTNTPKAQCLGEYTFFYSIIPHGQDVLPAWQEAWAFQTPLRAVVSGAHGGVLPPQASLSTVDNPRFVVSAVKTGEDGQSMVVRGYSISSEVETVTLTPGVGGLAARRTRIDESPVDDPIQPNGSGGFVFEARPAEIVTIRFERTSA